MALERISLYKPPCTPAASQYHHRMAPPIESAASTICLQWKGRVGDVRGEGQKEREKLGKREANEEEIEVVGGER